MKLSIYSYRGYLFQTISSRTNIDYILILFKDIFHAENIKYHNFNLVFSLFSLLCWMSLLEGWGVGGGGGWGKTLKIMIMVVNPINDFCSNKSIIINQSTLWEYSQQTEIGAMSDHQERDVHTPRFRAFLSTGALRAPGPLTEWTTSSFSSGIRSIDQGW